MTTTSRSSRRPCRHRHQCIDAEKDGTRRQRCLDCGAIVAVFRGPPIPWTDAELAAEARRRQALRTNSPTPAPGGAST